ncbi:head GIN domain-containing protein [Pontibacter indicus]|uniref:Putative auto-transporter adhesin, head GIN domain n=1 Tax=Pontibacter indicus TaxID=1317125 RepID=A0A1R3X3R5_9BACT|nr:head GIN domain-containing protein [Pontibacter indicus]SIT85311.1 Putative auto-transporter adhesin, head GIN domain [Pontibacter indicus]
MKSINFGCRVLLLLLPVLLFSSCDDEDCIRGRGDVETREFNLDAVSGLRVNGDARVFVRRGATQRIEVRAQPNVLDAINTSVSNGLWYLSFDRCLRSHKTMEVHMTVQELNSAEMIGSGRIELLDEFETNDFRAVLDGSGSLRINVSADRVNSRLTGSGNIELIGETDGQEISLTGSGNVKSFGLRSESAGVALSGSGNVEVHAANELAVTISGSGNVYYQGSPNINSTISGSGKVIKR